MRVIEDQCPFSDLAMAKNKRKAGKRAPRRHNSVHSDERDSDQCTRSKGCPHINKSVNMAAIRKAIKNNPTMQCTGCMKEDSSTEDINGMVDVQVWFCLQCGYQGCGRSSKAQHALKHWRQPRSDAHHIVLNTSTEMIWCYECDDELNVNNSRQLKDAVAHVTKHLNAPRHSQSRPNSSENGTEAPSAPTAVSKGVGGAVSKAGPKLKGLSNLGNTCFFNAVIQSLSQVTELSQLLNDLRQGERTLTLPGYSSLQSLGSDYEDSDGDDSKPSSLAPISIQLGKDNMNLTDSLVKLLREMTLDDGPRKPLNPRGLFEQMCSKAPRFKGYQQQDSHELLRNLLDALRNEELMRVRTGIKAQFNWKNLNEGAKKDIMPDIKCYGQQAKHTTVDALFGGYLLSSVRCSECGKASQIFEPFLDLSLPIYEERTRHTSCRRGSKSVADDVAVAEEREGPSKHQLKKAAKNSKRNKKGKQRVEPAPIDKDTPSLEPPATESVAADSEIASADAARPHSDSLSSSRSHTPKSELGYNSDSEDSTEVLVNGLSSSLEKLSVADGAPAERCHSATIRDAVDMSLKPLASKPVCGPQDCSILSSLGQFTHPELLTGPNKFACSFCNKRAKKRASCNEKPKTIYTDASKQSMIHSPPAILTLHLKRFQQNGYSFSKVNRHVEFTINLDLAPYCSSLAQGIERGQVSVKYSLFAVVEHSGRLTSGHYTAYVRQRSTASLHKTFLQKPLHGQKPLTVLLERMSYLEELERRDSIDEGSELAGASAGQEQETNTPSRWYHISDTHVKEVTERSVLSSQAYLLFYERVR